MMGPHMQAFTMERRKERCCSLKIHGGYSLLVLNAYEDANVALRAYSS